MSKRWIRLGLLALGALMGLILYFRIRSAYSTPKMTSSLLKAAGMLNQNKRKFNPSLGVGLELSMESSNGDFPRMASQQPRPPKDTGSPYFSPEEKQELDYLDSNRFVKISGFSFCSMLDGSSFDALVPIREFAGSLAATNPDISDFTNLIDAKAYDLFQGLMRKFHLAHQLEAKRLACYTAAEGHTAAANLTHTRLLGLVSPQTYFQEVLPAIVPRTDMVTKKQRFKLAYLMMVHEKKGFDQLVNTLEILDDGYAIILIHVDARTGCNELFAMIDRWIRKRKGTNPDCAIHLAKKRFFNIWGHISLVYTQLSGFWELLDMAEWDYVLNLSNYDYPLKSNVEIHETLSLPATKNKNFIQYWADTGDIAERYFRPHLGESDYSTVYHPPELGLVSSPFPRWRALKHHQWIIFTPEAVRYFRKNVYANTFLAFSEHTFIPDESFLGTALINAPEFAGKILNENKRYLRFTGGAHPSWLGYRDRHLFPHNEPVPSFFFIRKLNSMGNMFLEQKLIAWIKEKHMHQGSTGKNTKCTVEQMSVRIECIQEIAGPIAFRNSLIVIPVNLPYLEIALNLACSLARLQIKNVIFWALDLDVYETLLDRGKLAVLLPGLNPMSELQKSKSEPLQNVLRSKPRLLELFLNAGFSVWMMDADMVALQDFRDIQDLGTDIFISYANGEHIKYKTKPVASSALVYYRNGPKSLKFVKDMQHELDISSNLDDEDALRRVIARTGHSELLASDHSRLFPRADIRAEELDVGDAATIRVRYLDAIRFTTATIFIDHPSIIPHGFTGFYTLHWNGKATKKELLKYDLWLVDDEGLCVIDAPDPKPKFN
ncbi:hypothetical protein HDU91_005092 [Kappamyces sp. JEL0680]|nr:hypothetical protein HDU91_005092 [Kappamyces sp. JEL0680]